MWNAIQFVFYLTIELFLFYFLIYKVVKKTKHPTIPIVLFALTLGFIAISIILSYDVSYGKGESIDFILKAISIPFSSEIWSDSSQNPPSFTGQLTEGINQTIKVLITIIALILTIILTRILFLKKHDKNN